MADLTSRLAKLLPVLASDKAGEVVAATAAITRIMQAEGLDWHDLAGSMARGWAAPPSGNTAAPRLNEWQHIARACLGAGGGVLKPAEIDFVRNMAMRHTPPSERQWVWLDAIASALKVEVMA